MNKRRALCVGIDNYSSAPLQGCVSDAERIAKILARHEDNSLNFQCKTLTAPVNSSANKITRALLKKEIEGLFKYDAEVALFHFSGHGTSDNLGGYLVTQDAKQYDEGVSMSDVLNLANNAKASEVVILLDCCQSGQLGQLPIIDNEKAILNEGVSILTASRGDQPSVEVSGGGVFTSLVRDALEGGAADILGNVTAPSIYAFVEAALGAWEQRPLFKASVTKLVDLRRCHPAIDIQILRELPQIFPLPAEDLPLDPSFEPTSDNPDSNNVKIFGQLQELNRIRLVLPVGAKHLYDAAMGSKACQLTPTGGYYWRLAKSNLI